MTASVFPTNYVPTSEADSATPSRYFKPSKIESGKSVTLRLCGTQASEHVICGYSYFNMEGRPMRFPQFPANYLDDIGLTYDGKNKGTGEKDKPKFFLSWACLIKGMDDFMIIDIPQARIRESLENILDMEDYTIEPGEMANFYMSISKEGAGLDTKYACTPVLKPPTAAEVKKWHAARDSIWLPALFQGGDPFGGKPSGAAPVSQEPLTNRDELGADSEVSDGPGDGW